MLVLSSQVADVTSDLVDVKESVVGFENDLVVLSDEVATVKESVDVLDTSVEKLNNGFEELTEELDEIIGHDNSTDSELDDLKDQVADLATDLNNLDDLVREIDGELSDLSMTFENASFEASEWRYDTEQRLETIEASLGQTTTQPDVSTTQSPTECPNEKERTECMHWCDQSVIICLTECDHEISCMSNCWREQDTCHQKCPCNKDCPNGCDGICPHWSCPENLTGECPTDATCPPKGDCRNHDANELKLDCGESDTKEDECLDLGCCWQPTDEPYPWCSYPV
jgi:archaellum component FlaC